MVAVSKMADQVYDEGYEDHTVLDIGTPEVDLSSERRITTPSRRSREQIHADILRAIESKHNAASLNRIMMNVFLNRNETRRHLHELLRCQFVTTAANQGTFIAYSLTEKGREVLVLHQRIERAYQI
jgi:predicted transcriptional regulator